MSACTPLFYNPALLLVTGGSNGSNSISYQLWYMNTQTFAVVSDSSLELSTKIFVSFHLPILPIPAEVFLASASIPSSYTPLSWMDSCTSLAREKQLCTLFIWSSELTKFNGKCDSSLTRFNSKVHLIIYCIEDKVRQNCQGHLPIESWGSNRTPWLLNFFPKMDLGAPGSISSLNLGQWFIYKGLHMSYQSFILLS